MLLLCGEGLTMRCSCSPVCQLLLTWGFLGRCMQLSRQYRAQLLHHSEWSNQNAKPPCAMGLTVCVCIISAQRHPNHE